MVGKLVKFLLAVIGLVGVFMAGFMSLLAFDMYMPDVWKTHKRVVEKHHAENNITVDKLDRMGF